MKFVLLSTEAMMRLNCVQLCSMLLMERLPVKEVGKECVVAMREVKDLAWEGVGEILKEKKAA